MKKRSRKNDGVGGCGPCARGQRFQLLGLGPVAGVSQDGFNDVEFDLGSVSKLSRPGPMGQRLPSAAGTSTWSRPITTTAFPGQIHRVRRHLALCSPPAVWCSSAETCAATIRRPTCPAASGEPPSKLAPWARWLRPIHSPIHPVLCHHHHRRQLLHLPIASSSGCMMWATSAGMRHSWWKRIIRHGSFLSVEGANQPRPAAALIGYFYPGCQRSVDLHAGPPPAGAGAARALSASQRSAPTSTVSFSTVANQTYQLWYLTSSAAPGHGLPFLAP